MFNIKMFNTKKSYFIILMVMSVVGVGVLSSCKRKTKIEEITTTQFTLKITKTGTGTVRASWSGGTATDAQLATGVKVNKGTAVTLTATPDAITKYVLWNGTQTGNIYTVTMDKEQSISVAFSANPPVYHSISFTATPANAGTLKVYDMAGTPVTDITKIVENAKVRISIIPAEGKALIAVIGVNISGTDTTLTITANKSITATFEVAKYTVTFNGNGGSAVTAITADYNTTIAKPAPDPTKTGHILAGWYKEAGLTNAWNFATDKITKNTTLYAKWTIKTYTVSFNTNGGSIVTTITTDSNTTITQPANPTKGNYTFMGWYTESVFTNAWDFATNKVTANTTLYAKWVQTTFTVNGVSFDMLPITGGTFNMGATSSMDIDANFDESPTHAVTLSNYMIGKFEVTQGLWKAVMSGANPSNFKSVGDNAPVERVSWNDIQPFLTALNTATGKTFRLPTEAEWEFAARGGVKATTYKKYAGSNTIDDVAWYKSNGSQTHVVGGKTPNELGIYDMSGNVSEWCSDWFGNYSSGAQNNPTGPSSGPGRVLRGGNWDNEAKGCRSAYRDHSSPEDKDSNIGFRVVLSF